MHDAENLQKRKELLTFEDECGIARRKSKAYVLTSWVRRSILFWITGQQKTTSKEHRYNGNSFKKHDWDQNVIMQTALKATKDHILFELIFIFLLCHTNECHKT